MQSRFSSWSGLGEAFGQAALCFGAHREVVHVLPPVLPISTTYARFWSARRLTPMLSEASPVSSRTAWSASKIAEDTGVYGVVLGELFVDLKDA